MSNDQALVQVNIKSGEGYDATLVNVYAKTPDELVQLLEAVKEHAPLIAEAKGAVAIAHGIEVKKGSVQTYVAPEAAEPPAQQDNSGWGAPQAQQPPSFANPAQPQLASGSETDKWGNVWEYGRPDAPATPRGPAVLKRATSQAGKPYAKWEDPAAGPRWFTERQPKVDPSQRWQGQFARGV